MGIPARLAMSALGSPLLTVNAKPGGSTSPGLFFALISAVGHLDFHNSRYDYLKYAVV